MRVIAGTAKGRRLYAPKGMETRPITAKIKEALFNIWQDRIPGSDFLDLFAGSGSIGIEALSRGADYVVFVDKSRKAVEMIKKKGPMGVGKATATVDGKVAVSAELTFAIG